MYNMKISFVLKIFKWFLIHCTELFVAQSVPVRASCVVHELSNGAAFLKLSCSQQKALIGSGNTGMIFCTQCVSIISFVEVLKVRHISREVTNTIVIDGIVHHTVQETMHGFVCTAKISNKCFVTTYCVKSQLIFGHSLCEINNSFINFLKVQ